MGVEVVGDRVDSLDLRRDPLLDMAEEVGPVCRRPAAVRAGHRLAGGRSEGAEDVPLAAATVVDFLLGPPGRAALTIGVLRRRADGLLAGVALGRLRTHLVEADDDRALRRRRVEPLDGPLFSAKSGSTRSPNQVS